MMLCDVPLHPRTRSTKGPDCPNDIQKRLRSPRQHLDDRQHSINPLPKRPAIDQRTEFVRLVRIHELFRLACAHKKTQRFRNRRGHALIARVSVFSKWVAEASAYGVFESVEQRALFVLRRKCLSEYDSESGRSVLWLSTVCADRGCITKESTLFPNWMRLS